MNVHKNARLTPRGRERIVRQVASGQTPEAVAEAAGVCPRTVRKWVDRYRREGSRATGANPPSTPLAAAHARHGGVIASRIGTNERTCRDV
jgi:transposase-like protein